MGETRIDSLVHRLLHRDLARSPGLRAGLVWAGRFLLFTGREFAANQGFSRAASMAYTSLLALVPALAVFFAFFANFAAFGEILGRVQDRLLDNLVPASSGEILEYLRTFTQNTKALGIVGAPLLLLTTILLFDSIEAAFNHIWHVRRPRTFLRKFMAFTSVIVWGPAMIGLSFWLSGKLGALVRLDRLAESAALSRTVYFLSPLFLSTLAFVMAFLVVPATRVRLRSAAVGGVIAAVLWESAKVGFAAYVPRAVTYKTLYGPLSVIPIFLVWLYYTWLCVLIGLQAAYAHQNLNALLASRRHAEPFKGRERLLLFLWLFGRVAEAFHRGERPPDAAGLAHALAVPVEIVQDAVDSLEAAGLVRRVAGGEEGLVPARSLSEIALYDVVSAGLSDDPTLRLPGGDELGARLSELRSRIERAGRESVADVRFEEVIAVPRRGRPAGSP